MMIATDGQWTFALFVFIRAHLPRHSATTAGSRQIPSYFSLTPRNSLLRFTARF
jgi:hypothetical protein